jgi:hypothetical protein
MDGACSYLFLTIDASFKAAVTALYDNANLYDVEWIKNYKLCMCVSRESLLRVMLPPFP